MFCVVNFGQQALQMCVCWIFKRELSMMKEHDECVSKEAEESKEELTKALEESQRNAECVVINKNSCEYHAN